jgi:hypothetical protein
MYRRLHAMNLGRFDRASVVREPVPEEMAI